MLAGTLRRPAATLLLPLAGLLACGDNAREPDLPGADPDAAPAGVAVPLGVELPPLAFTLSLEYDDPRQLPSAPESIEGHLFLTVSDGGWVTGTMSARTEGAADITAIRGPVEGTAIVLEAGNLRVFPNARFVSIELRLSLLDEDGDGAIDGAQGEATGDWESYTGDAGYGSGYSSTLAAGLDQVGSSAELALPFRRRALLPDGAVVVHFEEPLREEDVRQGLRVLADGEAPPGTLSLTATSGLVTEAAFQPDDFLPFGAAITLDLAGLQDVAGNALARPAGGLAVVADPGAPALNTGFESGLTGWMTTGDVRAEGAFEGVAPVQGANHAVLERRSTLAALVEVPTDATQLDLSIAALVNSASVGTGLIEITLHEAGGGSTLVQVDEFLELLPACGSCTVYQSLAGPLRPQIDLVPYQGRRVLLMIQVFDDWIAGPATALVDDLQIR